MKNNKLIFGTLSCLALLNKAIAGPCSLETIKKDLGPQGDLTLEAKNNSSSILSFLNFTARRISSNYCTLATLAKKSGLDSVREDSRTWLSVLSSVLRVMDQDLATLAGTGFVGSVVLDTAKNAEFDYVKTASSLSIALEEGLKPQQCLDPTVHFQVFQQVRCLIGKLTGSSVISNPRIGRNLEINPEYMYVFPIKNIYQMYFFPQKVTENYKISKEDQKKIAREMYLKRYPDASVLTQLDFEHAIARDFKCLQSYDSQTKQKGSDGEEKMSVRSYFKEANKNDNVIFGSDKFRNDD